MSEHSLGISGDVSITPLEKSRREKAAQDAGFDLSAQQAGPSFLVFRSTAFKQSVGLAVLAESGYQISLDDSIVALRVASEFGTKPTL